MKRNLILLAVGATALAGIGGVAAAETEHGSNDVDVNVSITPNETEGVLAMTVDGTAVTLVEDGSTALMRQFTGTLPTVTVTDTRSVDGIEPGVGWYVLGTSSSFTGSAGQADITADHFGWAPQLIDGGDSGLVAEGDPVETVLDTDAPNPVGLVDKELLAMAFDSQEVNPEGSWTASADLFLRTPVDVEAGDYQAKMTLSLFE